MPTDRLHPGRRDRLFVVLTHLRRAIEQTIARHAPQPTGDRQLLDYGAGDSPYRPLFAAAGFDYTAADLADNPAADLALTPDGKVERPDASFDWILSSQVLEHVPDVPAYLREARRLVRPDGLMLLSTHGFWRFHGHPGDYWRWTRPGLVRQIEAEDWQVIDVINILNLTGAAIQLLQDATGRGVPRLLRPAYFGMCQSAIWLSEKLTRTPSPNDAAVFVVLARPANMTPGNKDVHR